MQYLCSTFLHVSRMNWSISEYKHIFDTVYSKCAHVHISNAPEIYFSDPIS
ncbi:hypothetical protein AHAS_Ahas01G0119200 [Arachis hypogaea]